MMKDSFGRPITYLRLSVTGQCNLRCRYCMPESFCGDMQQMSVDEILKMVAVFAKLGVGKVRLTGGEPLLRRDLAEICRGIRSISGIEEVDLTTNGVLLKLWAEPLKAAGLNRLNISLDTLQREKFIRITGKDRLFDVLEGVHAAASCGFEKLKINVVLQKGVNDDEIPAFIELTKEKDVSVRFIEQMPVFGIDKRPQESFLSTDWILKEMSGLEPVGQDGVAKCYRVSGYRGSIGLISPISHCFCDSCDRVRVTYDGYLKTCLHAKEEVLLRGLDADAMQNTVLAAVMQKGKRHHLAQNGSNSRRSMNATGG